MYAEQQHDDVTRSVLSVLVEDVDGIITRVTAMFTRRGFNLVSLVSAKTETPGIARLTVVVDASEHAIEQITKQLNKLVQVLKVLRLDEESTIARSMLLVKVNANNSNRPQVVDAANIFRARVVDVAPDSVVIEATGTTSKLYAFLDVLEPFGIREYVQSGRVALSRGAKTLSPGK
ncbi:acetolactate synthase small subunit [Corynebacterium aquatimens]|uniref:Acetolactate synthase small subunit n=1 Tax=Corynebacterium aquatimens TaxID=1190508 RepID=A0A931DWK7_9CORY|nr:acetolactate synthase small subunit [Corynebacterium aquatimens]MBG6121430.1 acetolactate synthase-1/3 small subunit [Corynebacterium aquatimens]WJY66026.1 Putative acetolactate synthase small subunit [Corynebacterium aquatimens]